MNRVQALGIIDCNRNHALLIDRCGLIASTSGVKDAGEWCNRLVVLVLIDDNTACLLAHYTYVFVAVDMLLFLLGFYLFVVVYFLLFCFCFVFVLFFPLLLYRRVKIRFIYLKAPHSLFLLLFA